MLKAIIVDDEEKARLNLESLLQDYCPQVEIIAMEGTIEGALNTLQQSSPDVVFLDIEMQRGTGFDLLAQLGTIDFDIVFITAYHEYAIKAFKFSAVDYLLKPINIEELTTAVSRVEEKRKGDHSRQNLELFLQTIRQPQRQFNKIALPTSDGLIFVDLEEIIQCQSIDNYTQFFLSSKRKILVSKTIKYFEDLLADHNFFRVHRSHLINLDHIERYSKTEGGCAIMSDGSKIYVSRRKKDAFLKWFNDL